MVCVCACVGGGAHVTMFVYVSVYTHISSPLPSARTLGSVYIEIGGLPKQRVSYSQGRDM